MPRKPYKEPPADDEIVERLIPLKGWVYKMMIARGEAQKRNAKHQISFELERVAEKMKAAGVKDNEPGPKSAASATA